MIKKIVLSFFMILSCNLYAASITGAYTKADTANKDVIAAATFAAKEINRGDLVKVETAQSQVVAGSNYKMRIQVGKEGAQVYTYDVVVFKPLPSSSDDMKLTSSTEVKTGGTSTKTSNTPVKTNSTTVKTSSTPVKTNSTTVKQ